MKILLVNNKTKHFDELTKALAGHKVEIQDYKPGIWFHDMGKDLIILSGGGGEGREVQDFHEPNVLWYEHEMQFIRKTDKPILGICMGFEVISAAFGAKITKMPKGIEGFTNLNTTLKGIQKLKTRKLRQFEAHDWRVKTVPRKHFDVLAKSNTGVEILRHKKRPIIATQFHPEVVGGTLDVNRIIKGF
jgi:GMP synthase-like glutamine amidotransferase